MEEQNKELNLVEILKDCPDGMELDCTMYEEATLIHILGGNAYPIKIETPDGQISLNKYGKYSNNKLAKCVIFPKGKTTWEGFVPPCKFKDGDVIITGKGRVNECVAIFKSDRVYEGNNSFNYHVLISLHTVKKVFKKDDWDAYIDVRLATEEEKAKIFKAIKANGYKWNAETKTLEKLIEPKFKVGDRIKKDKDRISGIITYIYDDGSYKVEYQGGGVSYVHPAYQDEWELDPNKLPINILKPFDKVLVRDDVLEYWIGDFYLYKDKDTGSNFPYYCVVDNYKICIPYNEETKHLLGTNKEAPEYYRL